MDKLPLMKCPSCNGAMIYDDFYSPYEKCWGWKCLFCGEIVDPVILANRKLMREGTADKRRNAREVDRRRC